MGRSTTHLALATHSMVTSEVPATTLVFLGGMMMVGAMGSAGPPTSGRGQVLAGPELRNPISAQSLLEADATETSVPVEWDRWPQGSHPSSLS